MPISAEFGIQDKSYSQEPMDTQGILHRKHSLKLHMAPEQGFSNVFLSTQDNTSLCLFHRETHLKRQREAGLAHDNDSKNREQVKNT